MAIATIVTMWVFEWLVGHVTFAQYGVAIAVCIAVPAGGYLTRRFAPRVRPLNWVSAAAMLVVVAVLPTWREGELGTGGGLAPHDLPALVALVAALYLHTVAAGVRLLLGVLRSA